MRIALVHTGGTLWLAGDPALTEREHPSAGNLRMDGKTATQVDELVGGDETVHTDRGNLATSVTFETSRIFSTVAAAEVWGGLYDAQNPRAGTLVGVGMAGLVESLVNWPGAVVQPPRREVIGCSVMLSYEVLCGLPVAVTLAAAVSGTLTDNNAASFTFGGLVFAGTYGSPRYSYTDDGTPVGSQSMAGTFSSLYYDGAYWNLVRRVAGAWLARWKSSSAAISPADIPTGSWHTTTNPDAWKPTSPATGTPVVAVSGVGIPY